MEKNIGVKIIVNMITTCRMLGSFSVLFLFNISNQYTFLIFISILFFTDFIDGFIARKFHVQTLYGSVMDAIADKILSMILLLLLLKDNISIFFILLGEFIIAIINTSAKLKGKHPKSSKIGKLKMWILSLTIILGYIYHFNIIKTLSKTTVLVINILTIIVQIFVIIEYIKYLKQQKIINSNNKVALKSHKNLIYKLFNTTYYLETIKNEQIKE